MELGGRRDDDSPQQIWGDGWHVLSIETITEKTNSPTTSSRHPLVEFCRIFQSPSVRNNPKFTSKM